MAELAQAIPDLRPDEADEIEPILRTFLDAMRLDDAAQERLARTRIARDLDVGDGAWPPRASRRRPLFRRHVHERTGRNRPSSVIQGRSDYRQADIAQV
jgi:hypothetical protein